MLSRSTQLTLELDIDIIGLFEQLLDLLEITLRACLPQQRHHFLFEIRGMVEGREQRTNGGINNKSAFCKLSEPQKKINGVGN